MNTPQHAGSGHGIAARPPASALAVIHGQVAHRRHAPRHNAFRYPTFCLRLPLSQLEALEEAGIAHNRRGLLSFHDRDHGARDGSPLLPWIRRLLAREGVAADGEIVLHTFPRMLGYVFNPVSFWVCHDRGGHVRAVLCAVANTFGERHNYLLADPHGAPLASGRTLTTRKVFHVSPFCEVRGNYRFRFTFSPSRWLARIDYHADEHATAPLLETWISGAAVPLAPRTAQRLLLRYPLFTLAVVARIHWQAAKLWAKHVPFFTKPPPPAQTTTR